MNAHAHPEKGGKSSSKVDCLTDDEIHARLQSIREEKERILSRVHKPPVLREESHPEGTSRHQYEPTDILKEEYRFIRSEQDDLEAESSWEKNLAKQYHDSLYKEYALADLSRYAEGKIGLRWRVEREVRAGKGERICGNKKCDAEEGLEKYEVPFMYTEEGEAKMALVKVTMCESCALKLQYHTAHKKVTKDSNSGASKKRSPEDPIDGESTPNKRAKDKR